MRKEEILRELKEAVDNYKNYRYEYQENGWTFPSPDPAVADDAVEYWSKEIDRLEKEIKEVE